MIINDVFTIRQTIITYTLEELLHMLLENRLVLRETNTSQVRKIRKYLFDNNEKDQVYLPPIVARLEEGSLEDGKPTKLSMIDGSQRIKALSQLEALLKKSIASDDGQEQKKGFAMLYALPKVELAVQIFEGLSEAEANQMFIDLNTKGKKVALSKRIAYDSRNSVNLMTNQLLQSNVSLRKAGVEQEKHAVMRPKNKKLLSLSQLRTLVVVFSTGRSVKSQAEWNTIHSNQMDESVELINEWFDKLFELHPAATIGNYKLSMLASFPLLTAVATYVLEGMEDVSFGEKKQEMVQRMNRLKAVDWSRENPVWRQFNGSERGKDKYFYFDNDKQNMAAMVEWLRRKGGE